MASLLSSNSDGFGQTGALRRLREREREREAWVEGIRCGRWEESLALREKQQKRKRENTLAVQCEKKEREGE